MSSFVNLDDEQAFLEANGHDNMGRDETDEMLLQHQLITSPLVNFSAVTRHAGAFPSRGLLGTTIGDRLYMNTNTPSSGVICGVQVSLVWIMSLTKDWIRAWARASILKACLVVDSRIGQLPQPLTALVYASEPDYIAMLKRRQISV